MRRRTGLLLAMLALGGCKSAPCTEVTDPCVCGGGRFLHCDPKP